jgi:hypothetical protein
MDFEEQATARRLFSSQRETLVPHTSETDASLWPTPTAQAYGSGQNGDPGDGRGSFAQKGKPSLWTIARSWPTACARDEKGPNPNRRDGEPDFATAATRQTWPTPTASDASDSRRHGYMITGHPAVASHHGQETREAGKKQRSEVTLNPEFVETLMGFSAGWTEVEMPTPPARAKRASKPSVTRSSRKSPKL